MKNEFKSQKIKSAIKDLLKKKKMTYEELSQELECSVPTVKRILGNEELTINRLIQICEILNTNLAELDTLSGISSMKEEKFTEAQENFLVKNPSHFSYFMQLLSGKSPKELAEKYSLDSRSTDKYLIALEKHDLIRVTGKQKVKPNFKMSPSLGRGPLAKNYFRAFISTAAQFFINIAHEAMALGQNVKPENKIRFTIHHMNLTQASYDAWVEQQEKAFKDLIRLSEFEEKSRSPSELQSAVILQAHAYVKNEHPALKPLDNVFGEIKNL